MRVCRKRNAGLDFGILIFIGLGVEIGDVEINARVRGVHTPKDLQNCRRVGSNSAMIFDSQSDPVFGGIVACWLHRLHHPVDTLCFCGAVGKLAAEDAQM